jgi:hypothetical protein
VPAAAFSHVLDRLIDGGHGPSAMAATTGILTAPLLGPSYLGSRAVAVLHGAPPPRVMRPRRPLTARQAAALARFRANGADLLDDFLGWELKMAFKRLARALHPDKHPDADAAQRRQLALEFAAVREAYEILQTG